MCWLLKQALLLPLPEEVSPGSYLQGMLDTDPQGVVDTARQSVVDSGFAVCLGSAWGMLFLGKDTLCGFRAPLY